MIPNQDSPLDRNPLSASDALTEQAAQLIRLLQTKEATNIKLAFLLAEGLGNPAAFQAYLQGLLPLYPLAFGDTPDQLDADTLWKLFQLTQLNVSYKELTVLPANVGQLPNLKWLYCSYNQLQALPASLGELQHLKILNCADNELQALPDSIGQLQRLEVLLCSANQLQALPDCLAGLPKLKKLDAQKNPLTHIPPALREKEGLELLLD